MFKCLECEMEYALSHLPKDITLCPYCNQNSVIELEEIYDAYANLYPLF